MKRAKLIPTFLKPNGSLVFQPKVKMQPRGNECYLHSLQDLEVVIQMGMEAGLTSTLERLEQLLLNLNKY